MTQTTTITRQLLRITTAGSVDDGKSTLIGRLLHDTDSLSLDHLEAVTDEEGVADLAALSDGLRAEREQGITIDVAYRFFSTDSRSYILADTPGHERYTRNMFTGASNAHVAILLVDAQLGVLRQTRRGAPQGGEPAGHRLGARSARRGGLAAVVVAPHVGDRACPSAAATRPSTLPRIDYYIIAPALDPHSLTIGTNVRDDAALDARLIASIRRYRKVPISQVARSGCSAKPAMDWVLERKQRIENALADRPLEVPQQPGRAHGVLQPITAIRTHSGVQVRDGQRRTLAARQVGLPSIPRLGVRGRGGGDGDRDGNRNLKGALGIAALAAARTKDTYFAAKYRRICTRRGPMKALVAVERAMVVAAHGMLTNGEFYRDPGADYFTARRPGMAKAHAIRQLQALGYAVTLQPLTA